jgi:hypothetical protein
VLEEEFFRWRLSWEADVQPRITVLISVIIWFNTCFWGFSVSASPSCLPGLDFNNASANDLSDCLRLFDSRVTNLEQTVSNLVSLAKQPVKGIYSAGTVEYQAPPKQQPNVKYLTGATITAQYGKDKGLYNISFPSQLEKDPIVIVGPTYVTQGTCTVVDENLSNFFVQCRDVDGPAWAAFSFVVLSR